MAKDEGYHKTVRGGEVRPDGDLVRPGQCGAASDPLTEDVLDEGQSLLTGYTRAAKENSIRPVADDAEDYPGAEDAIGDDDRVRVNNPRAYPFSAVVALRSFTHNGAQFVGTGTLVGPRLVLTAGHNIYKHRRGGFVQAVQVLPGLNGDIHSLTLPTVRARRFLTVQGWTQHQDQNADYGAIVLPTDLGRHVGWLGMARLTDGSFHGLAVNSAGYPKEPPTKHRGSWQPGTSMWFHSGNVTRVESDRVFYTIDTSAGQSGAAVFANFQDQAAPDQYQVVGIHNYGFDLENAGTRITTAVYDKIIAWIEESEGRA